jgi:hypothetical protein
VVVTGAGSGWETASNDVRAGVDDVGHVIVSFSFDP